MTIDEQNVFLFRKPKEFWTRKIKRHALRNCKCGATQNDDSVVMAYCGSGDYGAWNVYCRSCKALVSAKTEEEVVNKWNGCD